MSKPTKVAFALRDGVEFDGGSVVYDDGKTLDVAELLEEGNGVIVVEDDSKEHIALRNYPPLKSVAAPGESSKAPKKPSKAVVKKAQSLGVDLGSVDGSGKNGAITVKDVEAAAEPGESATAETAGDAGQED